MDDLQQIMKAAVAEYLATALPAKAIEMESKPPEMLSIDEVRARTKGKLSRDCIRYRLIPEGKIRYIRAGRRYLINWDSVVEYLKRGEA